MLNFKLKEDGSWQLWRHAGRSHYLIESFEMINLDHYTEVINLIVQEWSITELLASLDQFQTAIDLIRLRLVESAL